jgi:chorismate synthase
MRVLTAGESHGPAMLCVVEGLPAGLEIRKDRINAELARRQRGYGRGGRMKIERDEIEILSGVRHGLTLGSPITLVIHNKDHANWSDVMSPEVLDEDARKAALAKRERTSPRPGHADLAGALKYLTKDLRNIIERSSARDTTGRVAAGMLVQCVLDVAGAAVRSHVVRIEKESVDRDVSFDEMAAAAADTDTGCVDAEAGMRMRAAIDAAKKDGDTLGGEVEIAVRGLPPGLGSFAQWSERLDGLLAQALMSIPSVKAVAIGSGFDAGRRRGSAFHDHISREGEEFRRPSNNAGGIEGGISNGEELRARFIVKPIPTLMNRLPSVDLKTLEPAPAAIERSDTCVVPAAAVVGEAMVRLVIAEALLKAYGADSVSQFRAHIDATKSLRDAMFGAPASPKR